MSIYWYKDTTIIGNTKILLVYFYHLRVLLVYATNKNTLLLVYATN